MARPGDIGHDMTEALLFELENKISRMYKLSAKEMQEKLADYLRRFEAKDKIWREAVEAGTVDKKTYKAWRKRLMMSGDAWQKQLDDLTVDAVTADMKAMSVVHGYMPAAYAINHNYGTYQVESGGKLDTSYTIYNTQAVERLWRENPQLMPDPDPRGETARKLRENEDMRWNMAKIQDCVEKAIVQGKPIPEIASSLQTVSDMDRNAAVRTSRTMMTSAQNAGRYDSYYRCDDMGIDLTLEWTSTLDGRTRTSHRYLNGKRRNIGEPFEVDDEVAGHVKIMYPGDMGGKAYKVPQGMLWNCRCTIVAWVKGFEPSEFVKSSPGMGDMTYEEWLAAKPHSERITLPEEKAKAIKGYYINKYRQMKLGAAG